MQRIFFSLLRQKRHKMATRGKVRRELREASAKRARQSSAVVFFCDLRIEIMQWCTLADHFNLLLTCSAVSNEDFSASLNSAAGRRFELEYPYAHECIHPCDKWVPILKEWRETHAYKPLLTYSKNTRLALARRSEQRQFTKLFNFVLGKKICMEVYLERGRIEIVGMLEADEITEWKGLHDPPYSKLYHNMDQWCSILDEKYDEFLYNNNCETMCITHVCGRPLNTFGSIVEFCDFFMSLQDKFFSVSILFDTCGQFPKECYLPKNAAADALFDDFFVV